MNALPILRRPRPGLETFPSMLGFLRSQPRPSPSIWDGDPGQQAPAIEAPLVSNKPVLPRLPREILIRIFEELAKTPDVANLRLVSQEFEDLSAPIFYRQTILTVDLVVHLASSYCWLNDRSSKLAHQKMKLYTRHLVLGITVDWEPVIQLVLSLDKLQYIT